MYFQAFSSLAESFSCVGWTLSWRQNARDTWYAKSGILTGDIHLNVIDYIHLIVHLSPRETTLASDCVTSFSPVALLLFIILLGEDLLDSRKRVRLTLRKAVIWTIPVVLLAWSRHTSHINEILLKSMVFGATPAVCRLDFGLTVFFAQPSYRTIDWLGSR